MIHLRPLGFLDVHSGTTFSAKLRMSYWNKFVPRDDGIDEIPLIQGGVDLPIMNDWKSAIALLARIRNEAQANFGGRPVVIRSATIERLKVGTFTLWQQDDSPDPYYRVMIGLVPCPGAWVYCGGEGIVLGCGNPVLVNTRVMWCEANFGPCAQVALVLDVVAPSVN